MRIEDAIKALASQIVRSKLVREGKVAEQSVTRQRNEVRICCVAGHIDYEGNVEADRLARSTSSDLTMTYLKISISRKAINHTSVISIEEQLFGEQQLYWHFSEGCLSKLFQLLFETLHARVMELSSNVGSVTTWLAYKDVIVHLLHKCPAF